MKLLRRIVAERRAIVLPLAVFLIGNIVYLAAVVVPLQRTVAGASDAQFAATEDVLKARAEETKAKADRAGKERADVELRKFYGEILPRDSRTAIGVTTFSLTRIAERSRVTFKVGQWEKEEVKDSNLTKMTGQVTLIGEYANVRKFLYEAETAEEFLIIESVELSSGSATANDNLLELHVAVATYFRTNGQGGAVVR